jgi:hypothetical protein
MSEVTWVEKNQMPAKMRLRQLILEWEEHERKAAASNDFSCALTMRKCIADLEHALEKLE